MKQNDYDSLIEKITNLENENRSLRKKIDELKIHILALQGKTNSFQINKCESCQEYKRAIEEQTRAAAMLVELNKTVDKYNELAHKYNALESSMQETRDPHR